MRGIAGGRLPWRCLWRAREGIAILEFALMAPVVILLYLGTVEVALAYSAHRKTAAVAALAASLAAHEETIDARTAGQVLDAARAALEPVDAATLGQRLSAVAIDADGNASVTWSVAMGADRLPAGSAVTVPPALLLPGESVVMAETWLDYVSPLVLTLPGTRAMHHEHFVYPRLNDHVDWVGAGWPDDPGPADRGQGRGGGRPGAAAAATDGPATTGPTTTGPATSAPGSQRPGRGEGSGQGGNGR